MSDLYVDLDGLSDFADRLGRIVRALDAAKNALRGHDHALGDDTVVDALHRFEDRWRDGREKITDNATSLGTMVTESVRTFRQVDQDLATAITAPAGS